MTVAVMGRTAVVVRGCASPVPASDSIVTLRGAATRGGEGTQKKVTFVCTSIAVARNARRRMFAAAVNVRALEGSGRQLFVFSPGIIERSVLSEIRVFAEDLIGLGFS